MPWCLAHNETPWFQQARGRGTEWACRRLSPPSARPPADGTAWGMLLLSSNAMDIVPTEDKLRLQGQRTTRLLSEAAAALGDSRTPACEDTWAPVRISTGPACLCSLRLCTPPLHPCLACAAGG